ncbi:MAG: lysylphosphatidylglycerol synthase domain-containing protein [Phycisphaerae bacterium]
MHADGADRPRDRPDTVADLEPGLGTGAQAIRERSGRWRAPVQVLGFVACMALLWWCVRAALSPANRDQLSRLADASASDIALLLFLSGASVALNGLTFWLVLRPVRRLAPWHVQAVNATASMLSYAPAKLSLVYRAMVHTRRDGMPLLLVGAWLGATAVILLSTFLPLAGVAAWRGRADGAFWLVATVSLLAAFALLVASARLFAGERGLLRIRRLGSLVRLAMLDRMLASARFAKLHAAFDMLSSPTVVGLGLTIRVADLMLQAARFLVAARMLGSDVGFDAAVAAACTYYVIGVVSPSGSLGARESAATGLASLLASHGAHTGAFAPVALVVSASEAVIFLIAGLAGMAYTQPWRLLVRGGASRQP